MTSGPLEAVARTRVSPERTPVTSKRGRSRMRNAQGSSLREVKTYISRSDYSIGRESNQDVESVIRSDSWNRASSVQIDDSSRYGKRSKVEETKYRIEGQHTRIANLRCLWPEAASRSQSSRNHRLYQAVNRTHRPVRSFVKC